MNSSYIKGMGNDIIEIDRVRQSYYQYGERFLHRILSPQEQEYCLQHKDPAARIAARFSAKESIAKALGTGFGKDLSWLDINIAHDERGKPIVFLSPHAKEHFSDPLLLLSISHCRLYVVTSALWMER